MTATWPVSLPPRPTLQGYSEELPSTAIRSAMDTGPAKVRRRFTAAAIPFKVRWMLNASQVEDFRNFFRNDVYDGSLSFMMEHPRTGDSTEFRFDLGQGPPTITPLGNDEYEVSAALEQMP